MHLCLRPCDSFVTLLLTGNIIASFITSYVRLCLYEKLQELQDCVLYYDTDSIIYVTNENQTKLTCGNFLGKLTSKQISEFCSSGPKCYSHK